MTGLEPSPKYIISWEGSESTESLKLQILKSDRYPSGSYSLIDVYKDGIHTIAVKSITYDCIFLVFRLKFELDDLNLPMIQFTDKGSWYHLHTYCNHSFTIDYINKTTSNTIDKDGFYLIYNSRLSVSDCNLGIISVIQFYNILKSTDGTVKESLRIYEGDLDYRMSIPAYKLFGNKTALKLKLASLGRKGIQWSEI